MYKESPKKEKKNKQLKNGLLQKQENN